MGFVHGLIGNKADSFCIQLYISVRIPFVKGTTIVQRHIDALFLKTFIESCFFKSRTLVHSLTGMCMVEAVCHGRQGTYAQRKKNPF